MKGEAIQACSYDDKNSFIVCDHMKFEFCPASKHFFVGVNSYYYLLPNLTATTSVESYLKQQYTLLCNGGGGKAVKIS